MAMVSTESRMRAEPDTSPAGGLSGSSGAPKIFRRSLSSVVTVVRAGLSGPVAAASRSAARLFLELRVRLLEGFAHLRPGLVGSARKLHPGVARGRLHLAQLLDRLIAPLAKRGQLFLEFGAHSRLRRLGLRLPFRGLGVPLVELRLELLDVLVAVDHKSS